MHGKIRKCMMWLRLSAMQTAGEEMEGCWDSRAAAWSFWKLASVPKKEKGGMRMGTEKGEPSRLNPGLSFLQLFSKCSFYGEIPGGRLRSPLRMRPSSFWVLFTSLLVPGNCPASLRGNSIGIKII